MTDLRDIRGRLVRLALAMLLAAPLSIGATLALASIIHEVRTAATTWFHVSIPVMVFIPATAAINHVLTRFLRFRPRSNLPVARLVRR